MITTRSLILAFALMFGSVAGLTAQQIAGAIDDFAAGADDFIPADEDQPIDQLISDFPSQKNAVSEGVSAESPVTAEAATALPKIPEGWATFEKNGLSVSAPADWKVLMERDDAMGIVKDFDPKTSKGLLISIIPMDERTYERDFSDDEVFGKSGSGTRERIEDAKVGGDIEFRQFKVGSGDQKEPGGGFMIVSPWSDSTDEVHMAIGIIAMGRDPGPDLELLDQIRKTVQLVDPDTYRKTIIEPFEETKILASQPRAGMDGLITYKVSAGWRVRSDTADFLSFQTEPEFTAYLTIGTRFRSELPNGISAEFEREPESSSTTILGQGATLYTGMTPSVEVMDGYSMVKGVKQLYVLDQCLTDKGPIHVTLVGAPKWLEGGGFAPLLENLALEMPQGAQSCAAKTDTQVSQSNDHQTVDPANDPAWVTYANSRFGTVIDYPSGYLESMPEPDNNDGRTLESPDGKIRILVFGSHNLDDKSLPALMAAKIADGGFQAVTASSMEGDRFEIGGMRAGRSVIHVEILDTQNVIHTLDITHDPSLSEDVLADLREIAISFRYEHPLVQKQEFPPTSETAVSRTDLELAFWNTIANSDDPADFEAYLAQWPDGTFAPLAANRLRKLQSQAVPEQTSSGNNVRQPPTTAEVDLARTHTPKRGTKERQSIMNAARIPIGNELGQRVIFVVSTLRSDGNWAFLQATPVQPDGSPVNWLRTKYASDWKADVMSDVVMVLLKKSSGSWQSVDYVIGPTDVHWYVWLDQYGLPEGFFIQ